MDLDEYNEIGKKTRGQAGSPSADMFSCAMGLLSEAGELVGVLRKAWAQGHPYDHAKVVIEAGDVMFYVVWAFDLLDERAAAYIDTPSVDAAPRLTTRCLDAMSLANKADEFWQINKGSMDGSRVVRLAQVAYWVQQVCAPTPLGEILDANVKKLATRFPKGTHCPQDDMARVDTVSEKEPGHG